MDPIVEICFFTKVCFADKCFISFQAFGLWLSAFGKAPSGAEPNVSSANTLLYNTAMVHIKLELVRHSTQPV